MAPIPIANTRSTIHNVEAIPPPPPVPKLVANRFVKFTRRCPAAHNKELLIELINSLPSDVRILDFQTHPDGIGVNIYLHSSEWSHGGPDAKIPELKYHEQMVRKLV